MTMTYRIGFAGGALVLALAGLVYVAAERGGAGEAKGLAGEVRKISAALKKGDKEGAEKLAKGVAKMAEEGDGIADVMHLFKLRTKKGLGVGETKSAKNDGIEAKLREIGRDAPVGIAKDAAALEQLGYDTAAIAVISEVMAPKDQGKKTRKEWVQWSQDMREQGIALAQAAKAQGAQDVKAAAVKVNNTCNACHSIWR